MDGLKHTHTHTHSRLQAEAVCCDEGRSLTRAKSGTALTLIYG